MKLLNKIAALLGLGTEELAAKKRFPANPNRIPHTVTGAAGTIRTRNSFWSLDSLGNRVGKAHGPANVGEHQKFYSFKPSRSKYRKPKASIPGGLRRRLSAA